MRPARRAVYLIVTLLVLLLESPSALAQVRYVYDSLDRLTQVIDANGNVATYSYDAAGNLLSIARSVLPTGTLSILSFKPAQAAVGQTVTIQGQGFSTTPASNTVKFNGVAATVFSATANTLVATVPSGATTGSISVTVGGNTVQSTSFTVVVVLVSITVSPAAPSVAKGISQQFTATGIYSDKSMQNLSASVAWSALPATVAQISPPGNVSTLGVGTATIGATSGAISGTTTLTVTPAALVSIAVSPANSTAEFGMPVIFTALGTYTDGTTQYVTSPAWNSSNTAAASIDSSGIVTPTLTAGNTTITATSGTVSGNTMLTVEALSSIAVTPPTPSPLFAQTVQFTATGTFANSVTENLTASVTWNSSSAAVATISNAAGSQGLASTTSTSGPSTISAMLGTVTGNTTLTVPALSSIAVTPANPFFAVGSKGQFTATGTFANSATENLSDLVMWSSSVDTVATISNTTGSQGLATMAALGTTTIGAALDSVSGSTLLTVTTPGSLPSFPRFAVVASSSAISSFAVDAATGLFRPLGYANVSGVSSAATDPLGQFLYVFGTTFSTGFGGFTINANTGALTAIPGPFPPFSTGLDVPSSVTVDPTGSYAFVTGQEGLYAYSIGGGGVLTEVSGSPFSAARAPYAVTVDPQSKYVYVLSNGSSATVAAYAITPGAGAFLTPVSGSPFATGSTPASIAIDPTDSYLYVASELGKVYAYTISSGTGGLTPVSGSPFAAGTSPLLVRTEPTGKFLYVLDYGPSGLGGVTAFNINAGGALSVIAGSPFPVSFQSNSMAVDPTGAFLYVTSAERSNYPIACCLNDITMYAIQSNGALAGARTFRTRGTANLVTFTQGNAPLAFTPKFAYVANEGDNNISASSINPTTGALTALTNSPFPAGTQPVSVTTDPTGAFAYVANQSDGTISAYTIDPAAGGIQQTTGSPFMAGTGPAAVAVDPSSRFAFAANQTSNNVSAYTIGAPAGALTPVAGSPFALPLTAEKGPFSIAVDALGLFAYVADLTSSDIANFVIASSTGALMEGNSTLSYGTPVGSAPKSIVVEPAGNFVYVANSSSNNVSGFAINDPAFGDLNSLPGSPFMAGTTPSALAVHPLGKFLYAANTGSNNVSGYSINPTTGALTAVTNSPFAAGTKPSAVAVDYSGMFLYVTNSGDDTVSIFSIDPGTGVLSPVPAPTAPTGSNPKSIVTTGTIH